MDGLCRGRPGQGKNQIASRKAEDGDAHHAVASGAMDRKRAGRRAPLLLFFFFLFGFLGPIVESPVCPIFFYSSSSVSQPSTRVLGGWLGIPTQ